MDLSKVSARQNRVNLRVALDLVEVGSNPILQMENEDCEAPPCVLDVDIIQIDSSSEESACSDPDVVGAFQQSLTASYLEKFFYDRVKLQFTARPANGNVTLDEAVRSIANACYGSIKDPKAGFPLSGPSRLLNLMIKSIRYHLCHKSVHLFESWLVAKF